MKAVILDTDKNEATVMTEGGDIIGIKNNGYEIGQEIILRRRKKRASINRITGIVSAAAAALVITGGIGGYTYYTPYGTVSLDVNPSIEYTINRFDRVLDVTGINDDGDDILFELDTKSLINRNIETAIEDTIEQIDAEGYFSDEDGNYVVLTANTKEEAHTDTLLSNLDNNVKQRENLEPISFKVSDDEITEAHSQGISPGKKMMVDRLEGVSDEKIDRGEWNRRSVRDIVNEYDRIRDGADKIKAPLEDGHNTLPDKSMTTQQTPESPEKPVPEISGQDTKPEASGITTPDSRQEMTTPDSGQKPVSPGNRQETVSPNSRPEMASPDSQSEMMPPDTQHEAAPPDSGREMIPAENKQEMTPPGGMQEMAPQDGSAPPPEGMGR
ncbi:MAG: anti-sigma factor domain-containing protein [Lachnospiraceae bacterium]|jgi:hypothetical protein|nr:anti-sigma factor domain-containing protein [Lachnospiraceae bacterium]